MNDGELGPKPKLLVCLVNETLDRMAKFPSTNLPSIALTMLYRKLSLYVSDLFGGT